MDADQADAIRGEDQEQALLNFDFRRYFASLRRYMWVVFAIIALALAASVVYTERQPKIYEAKASVQIEPRLRDLLGQGQDLLSVGGTAGVGLDYYKEQLKVLSSYKLAHATVDQYQLHTKLLTDQERAELKLEDQITEAAHRLQNAVTVKYPDQDRIMYVTVRNESPELAAELSNDMVDAFVDFTKGLLRDETSSASDALLTEFEKSEKALREADEDLFRFQRDNDLLAVSLEDRQSMMSSNITSFNTKLNEERGRRIEIGAKLERMRKATEVDVLESPILLMGDTGSFDALRAQYYTERNKFIEVEKQVGPKHSDYQMQKAKVDDLYNALQSEAKRMVGGVEEQYKAALGAEQALALEVQNAVKEALGMTDKIAKYNEKVRKKKMVEDRYTILRNRLSTSELTGSMNLQSNASYAKELDRALPPTDVVSPSLRINMAAAGALSVVLSLGLVLLLVFLDRSIKTAVDAQQAAGVAVLGVIPAVPESDLPRDDDRARDLFVHDNPKSPVAECCRSLRTNIMFSAADRRLKTIMVSSASQREGKTTTVIYLGTTMAQSDQRVLLVDTDMRRPRLHASTGVSRARGLSNLILGDEDYDEVIKATLIPNLYVLPCGPLPPNPAELLMTQRFNHVLAELSTRFDRIILDSPPIQAVTDAVVLSKKVDGVILVALAGKTLRDDMRRSARMIRNVGSTTLGVIVNGIDKSVGGYYYNYYSYGYGEDAAEVDPAG